MSSWKQWCSEPEMVQREVQDPPKVPERLMYIGLGRGFLSIVLGLLSMPDPSLPAASSHVYFPDHLIFLSSTWCLLRVGPVSFDFHGDMVAGRT